MTYLYPRPAYLYTRPPLRRTGDYHIGLANLPQGLRDDRPCYYVPLNEDLTAIAEEAEDLYIYSNLGRYVTRNEYENLLMSVLTMTPFSNCWLNNPFKKE